MNRDQVHNSFLESSRMVHEEIEALALDWVSNVLEEELPEDLITALRSGVALCRLLNKIFPGSCQKFNNSAIPFMQLVEATPVYRRKIMQSS